MKNICSFCKHLEFSPKNGDSCRKSFVQHTEYGSSIKGHNCINHSSLQDHFEPKSENEDKMRADRYEDKWVKQNFQIRELNETIEDLKKAIQRLSTSDKN